MGLMTFSAASPAQFAPVGAFAVPRLVSWFQTPEANLRWLVECQVTNTPAHLNTPYFNGLFNIRHR